MRMNMDKMQQARIYSEDQLHQEEPKPTESEARREYLQETESPDLPFAQEKKLSVWHWSIIIAMVVFGLAIPFSYVLMSWLGAVSASKFGFIMLLVFLGIGTFFLIGVSFYYVRRGKVPLKKR